MLKQCIRVVLFLCLVALPLLAQVDRASITGTIFDPSRAVVGGATVEITNLETQFTQRTTSSESGTYTIVGLPIGRYAMNVTAAGFKTVHMNEVRLQVGETRKLDAVLD